MIPTLIIIGTVTCVLTGLVCYLFLRRTLYNVFDPLTVVNIAIPFSAALLAVLCFSELVSWDKFVLFALTLLAYLAGARIAGAFFGRETFRTEIVSTLREFRVGEIYVILAAAAGITLILAVLGVEAGASGDARQQFGRIFRPIVLIQNGLALFSMVLLLSPRVPLLRALVCLTPLMVLSIPFSGKGVFVPVLYWLGLKLYVERRSITLRAAAMISSLVLVGAVAMAALAYGKTQLTQSFLYVTQRFWLSGDVYMLAYQANGLAAIRGNYPVSFLAYVMHPITSLVGMRAYDKPLGAMLASEVMRDDLLTGPNPQLPVVLDYFFPDDLIATLSIAFITGLLVIGIRPLGMTLAGRGRSRYLRLGGIVAAVFCPGAGFIDTSQVLIALVGIAAITFLLAALEVLLAGKHTMAQPGAMVPRKVSSP